ncbi:hypothetical protein Dip510_001686 [Elusimicrobium posterum]|uniref:polysaccharide deacetylase family protein n=1 Tax=Elusimicrobium posterum TaxID=3116653 RepID=UPI003C770587
MPNKRAKNKADWVSPAAFAAQLTYLKNISAKFLTFEDLSKIQNGKMKMPANPVLLTFECGYKNFITNALPLIKEYGAKANVFLVYNAVGHHNAWVNIKTEPWQDMLTWEDIAALKKSKLVSFGSSGLSYGDIISQTKEQAEYEVKESKNRFEAAGLECSAFAVPLYSKKIAQELRDIIVEAGYSFYLYNTRGVQETEIQKGCELKRIFISSKDNMFDFKTKLKSGKGYN